MLRVTGAINRLKPYLPIYVICIICLGLSQPHYDYKMLVYGMTAVCIFLTKLRVLKCRIVIWVWRRLFSSQLYYKGSLTLVMICSLNCERCWQKFYWNIRLYLSYQLFLGMLKSQGTTYIASGVILRFIIYCKPRSTCSISEKTTKS